LISLAFRVIDPWNCSPMQNMELVDGESIADDLRGWLAFFFLTKNSSSLSLAIFV
jgi:hypothetical protein